MRGIDYSKLPESVRHGVRLYIEEGVEPGSFLTAVICNDLRESVRCASEDNLAAIRDIVSWFWNEVSGSCWGSREAMRAWIDRQRFKT